MNKKNLELMLYASSVLLAIGVFLPLTKMAVIGEISYHRIAEIESYLVVAFALSAPVLLYLKRTKFVFISVAGVWLTLLSPALRHLLSSGNQNALGKLGAKASGAMQDFASHLFTNIFHFSWGGYVFLIALLLFTYAGVLRGLKKK